MSLSVEVAAEVFVAAVEVAADGSEVLVGVAEAGGAVGDVVAQNEVGATEVRAAFHCVGQSIKLGGGGDDVRVLLRATARNAIKNCCTNLIGGSRFSGIIIGFQIIGIGTARQIRITIGCSTQIVGNARTVSI